MRPGSNTGPLFFAERIKRILSINDKNGRYVAVYSIEHGPMVKGAEVVVTVSPGVRFDADDATASALVMVGSASEVAKPAPAADAELV